MKKYRTIADAFDLGGRNINDLTKAELVDRMRTIRPIIEKRKSNIMKNGLDYLSTLPPTQYKGKSRNELTHIFQKNQYWYYDVKASSVRGAKSIENKMYNNLGSYEGEFTNEEIGEIWRQFHNFKQEHLNYFIGTYTTDYIKEIVHQYRKTGKIEFRGGLGRRMKGIYERENTKLSSYTSGTPFSLAE